MCGSDLHVYRTPKARENPNIAGHEPCGVVVEVGRGSWSRSLPRRAVDAAAGVAQPRVEKVAETVADVVYT